MMNTDTSNFPKLPGNADEVDLNKVLRILRRQWLPLLLLPILSGAATYGLLNQVPPTYQARTSLMAALPDSSNQALSGAVVTASQLPQGAVSEVVHSRAAVTDIISAVRASSLPHEIKANIARDLSQELSSGQYKRVSVRAKVDQLQRGVYDLTSQAESPEAARILANAAAQALMSWDTMRAKKGVKRARENIQLQVDSVTSRLNSLPPNSLERESLISARGQLLLNLSQATVLEQSISGSLILLSEANNPSHPVAPKPLRNAVLAFLLTLFATAGIILLTDSLRRRITTTDDLPPGLAVLGRLPLLPRTTRKQTVGLARNGAFYEAAGFIQVNLLSLLQGKPHAIVAFTSARPTEGKSTAIAVTANALAMSGRKVLVIDFDLHRPTQWEYWNIAMEAWKPLPGANLPALRQSSVIQAIEHPQHASVLKVAEGIDLMPATEVGRRSSPILNSPILSQRLREWAEHYDVVLIDTPPVLSMPDAFLISRDTEGIVLVVESGGTSTAEFDQVLRNFGTTQSKLLGVILNKAKRSGGDYAYYGYSDRSKTI